jgi:hypothetical protein
MAVQIEVFTVSAPAAADLSAASNYGLFCKLDTAGRVALCTGTTDKPFGVIITVAATSAVGSAVGVARLGRCKIQGDANLAKADMIGTSADGQAAAYVFGTDTTKYIVGEVVDDNLAAAGYITADINCINPARGA